MEKANSGSDETADSAGRQLGISRSERFDGRSAMAIALDGDTTTAAIDAAIANDPADHGFTDAAAFALVREDSQEDV